jgi:hypothetical protein
MTTSDPIRVEIDLPIVVISHYGKLVLDNHKDLEDILTPYFAPGDVVNVHVILESTGDTRGFCDFIDPESTYHSVCHQTLTSTGVCWMESEHEKKRVKQMKLDLINSE